MKNRILLLLVVSILAGDAQAQWSIHPGLGIPVPITGYSTIVKSGFLYQVEAIRRLNNQHWGLGLRIGWARMHKDKDVNDAFPNPRLDQVPMLATIDYELSGKKIIPYVGWGLGVSFYNLSYDPTSTTGKTVNNVSFSMMPKMGFRIPATVNIHPFLEVNCPMVMDGPPIGVEKSEKLTGMLGLPQELQFIFELRVTNYELRFKDTKTIDN